MQWNHREANRVSDTHTQKKHTGEQIKLFMWHQMAVSKLMLIFSFFFSNVWCESHFYFRILVLFLLRVKILGDGIFSGELFRNIMWSKYWVNDNVDTMVKNKIPAQQKFSVMVTHLPPANNSLVKKRFSPNILALHVQWQRCSTALCHTPLLFLISLCEQSIKLHRVTLALPEQHLRT